MSELDARKILSIYQLIDRDKSSMFSSIVCGEGGFRDQLPNINWYQYYELSDKNFRKQLFKAAGQEALGGKLKHSERLNIFSEIESAVSVQDQSALRAFLSDANHKELLAISVAARFNFEAMKKFQRTINDMLGEIRAKNEGYESLIFKAAKIDSMVIATDTISEEQKNRVLNGDMSFIKKLSQAINPATSDKRQRHANTVRFLIYSLHKSSGNFPTVDELVSLNRQQGFLVEGEDVGEALRYHLREYKKQTRSK